MSFNNIFTIMLLLISSQLFSAQLLKCKDSNLIPERLIYTDEHSEIRYSDLITIKFNDYIIKTQKGKIKVELSNIKNKVVKGYFTKLKYNYGDFELLKVAPHAQWGDTLVTNNKSGKLYIIPDWSQVIRISFRKLVPIDSIINDFRKQSFIKYAEEPIQAYSMTEPNDEIYLKNDSWALKNIMAAEAWDLTKGDSLITIGILDRFGISNCDEIHEDLRGKVQSHFNKFGDHGTIVAGIAGANTNNNIGIASLGWNLRLRFYSMGYWSTEILRAINDGVDVLNFSWLVPVDFEPLRDAIKTALAHGVICVAAAGNNQNGLPTKVFPASYNFGELGQVIAVSATENINGHERFIDGWNFSPGDDPISDSESAFIDVAAPGRDIAILDKNCSNGYAKACGTSLSAPFVSALVGLLLSIDSTLTPKNIYDILTKSTDKIGQYTYNENGWNQYLGYGRINAYKALISITPPMGTKQNNKYKIYSNYSLEQNYPNPFNPSTTIRYTIPCKSEVTLKVYDVIGNEIITLVNEVKVQGHYEAIFDISTLKTTLSTGVYLYRLSTDEYTCIKKAVFVK